MTDEQPQLLNHHGNSATVMMPGRKFPGVWIAADTLSTFLSSAKEAVRDNPESDAAQNLVDRLEEILDCYEADMQQVGLRLSYNR